MEDDNNNYYYDVLFKRLMSYVAPRISDVERNCLFDLCFRREEGCDPELDDALPILRPPEIAECERNVAACLDELMAARSPEEIRNLCAEDQMARLKLYSFYGAFISKDKKADY